MISFHAFVMAALDLNLNSLFTLDNCGFFLGFLISDSRVSVRVSSDPLVVGGKGCGTGHWSYARRPPYPHFEELEVFEVLSLIAVELRLSQKISLELEGHDLPRRKHWQTLTLAVLLRYRVLAPLAHPPCLYGTSAWACASAHCHTLQQHTRQLSLSQKGASAAHRETDSLPGS